MLTPEKSNQYSRLRDVNIHVNSKRTFFLPKTCSRGHISSFDSLYFSRSLKVWLRCSTQWFGDQNFRSSDITWSHGGAWEFSWQGPGRRQKRCEQRIPNSATPTGEFEQRNSNGGIPTAEFQRRNSNSGIPTAEFQQRNSHSRTPTAEFPQQNSDSGIPTAEFRPQNSDGIQSPGFQP